MAPFPVLYRTSQSCCWRGDRASRRALERLVLLVHEELRRIAPAACDSVDTVTCDWKLAKSWLLRELRGTQSHGG